MPPPADIPDRLAGLLRAATGLPVEPQNLRLINKGQYGNADVYRCTAGALDLVIKEFLSKPWPIRATVGRFMIRREARALGDLADIAGIPAGGRRLGPFALAEAFVAGETLVHLHRARHAKLPKSFFLDLERLVGDMHRAGYAHLDLRNLGNILCAANGRPCLLDFQSCIRTARWPSPLRRLMEKADRSGVYKCWRKLCAEPLDPERAAFLDRFGALRKLWIFEGYWIRKAWRRWRPPPAG
jgi:hypothetical protein